MPASLGEVLGGLVLLALAMIPTGLSVLRVIEMLLRPRFLLTAVERTILAFYATGFLFFLLASIPLPIYGTTLVAATLILGTSFYAWLVVRKYAEGFRAIFRVVRQPAIPLLIAGTAALLLFEIGPVWNHPFPNAWDGSVAALWTNLILRQGTLPSSLQPFASAPVIYPMGTFVWMTLPVLILGWPIVQTPVLLPPLFLSLTVPASYAWGARWCRDVPSSSTTVGLVFAAFFGLVASWPRLIAGGPYDFAFALPLLLVVIGFLPEWAARIRPDWRMVVGLGLIGGALTTLSLAAGETLIVLLFAYTLALHRGSLRDLAARIGQIVLVVLFEVAFSARSLLEWATSYGVTYVPASYYGALDPRLVMGELDPFVPWKPKLSPFPAVCLELQILLSVGLIIVAVLVLRPGTKTDGLPTHSLASFLGIGTVAAFLMAGFLLLTDLPGDFWTQLRSITNLEESSIVLFIFFAGVALLPLAIVASAFHRDLATTPSSGSSGIVGERTLRSRRPRRPVSPGPTKLRELAVVVVLVIPLALGAVTTVIEGPAYLQSNVGKTSNVTSGDVAALEWASANLPACSVVLVAPGSAAQFLPEYATLRIAFPMNPVPNNGSYQIAVTNLTEGVYSSMTRTALVALGVTEVFVTGQTSASFLPFSPAPLENSPDFSRLFIDQDAEVFAFVLGDSAAHCPA